jgi:hypothetical protein
MAWICVAILQGHQVRRDIPYVTGNPRYVGPGYYVLVRSQVAVGEGYRVWREVGRILSKQSRSTDKGVSPNSGFVRVLNIIDRRK